MLKKILISLIIFSPTLISSTAFAKENEIKVHGNLITITQVPCQFVESESKNLDFKTNAKSDCEKINGETKEKRYLKPLVLKPGKYTFRVTNSAVPYEVGFYLRGIGWGWLTQPKVSGGGLFKGVTKDYTIDLKPGKYVYSCPLNPTLDYPLVCQE
jgi:hypothetical protein